jgi:hypothetical protein
MTVVVVVETVGAGILVCAGAVATTVALTIGMSGSPGSAMMQKVILRTTQVRMV